MTAVWEREDLNQSQKLILLALSDWANDEGLCWPSINRLAIKASMAARSVQRIIRQLEDMQFVRRDEVTGKGNRYWISIPLTDCHPRHSVTPPLTECHPTPDTVSPNTSYTHHLTTKDNKGLPDWLPLDAWNGWLEMRKQIKKPASERAMKMAIKKLEDLAQQGHEPEKVLDQSTMASWTDLYPIKKDAKQNGKRNYENKSDGLSSTARAALSVFGGSGESYEPYSGHQDGVPQPINGLPSPNGSQWHDGRGSNGLAPRGMDDIEPFAF